MLKHYLALPFGATIRWNLILLMNLIINTVGSQGFRFSLIMACLMTHRLCGTLRFPFQRRAAGKQTYPQTWGELGLEQAHPPVLCTEVHDR